MAHDCPGLLHTAKTMPGRWDCCHQQQKYGVVHALHTKHRVTWLEAKPWAHIIHQTAPFAESALETVTRHGRSICTRTLPGTQKKRPSLPLRPRLSSFPGWLWGSWHQHWYPSTLVTCLKLTPTIGSFRWMLIICLHCIPSCIASTSFSCNFYKETMETVRKSVGSHGGVGMHRYASVMKNHPLSGHEKQHS